MISVEINQFQLKCGISLVLIIPKQNYVDGIILRDKIYSVTLSISSDLGCMSQQRSPLK